MEYNRAGPGTVANQDVPVAVKGKAPMASLILNSLEIRNFRGFRHLQIERLGRVNLIVGKNNVGKTALLEALWLYSHHGSPSAIWHLLEERNESKRLPPRYIRSVEDTQSRILDLKYLFHGRNEIQEESDPIQIGPVNSQDKRLCVRMEWLPEKADSGQQVLALRESRDMPQYPVPYITAQFGTGTPVYYRLDLDRPISKPVSKEILSVFVTANGLGPAQIGALWDKIALTNLEADVVAALRLVAPKIDRVNLVGNQEQGRERIVMARMADADEPVPLRSLGEGMYRLFGIGLALVNAKDGLLLVDEIESGLHYSVLPDVWRLIFEGAQRLNVQVLATTHSWDCIESFQIAAQEDTQEEAMLISLREKQGQQDEIVAVLYDERRLGIATREKIEVR